MGSTNEARDETRRLLYMALWVPTYPIRHELIGTITNALLHHDLGLTEVDDRDVVLQRLAEHFGVPRPRITAASVWLLDRIDQLTQGIDANAD